MKTTFLAFSMLFLLASCSSSKTKVNNSDRNIYISSGVERFFHASRPDWSRFSEISSCRQADIKFMDFKELRQSYQFDYTQSIYLQNLYNLMVNKRIGKTVKKSDQNKVFFEAYQQVDSGAKPFPPIRSQQIYIVSIDSYINSDSTRIKKYIESDLLNKGQVFIMSRCLNSFELKKWKDDHQIYFQVGVIGFDFFSIYNTKIDRENHWGINLAEIFKGKEIYFISKREVEAFYINGYKKKWIY